MGVDSFVYKDGKAVSKEYFLNNGFPSHNLRHFNIFGWIAKFDDYATLMKKVDRSEMEEWYNHIITTKKMKRSWQSASNFALIRISYYNFGNSI